MMLESMETEGKRPSKGYRKEGDGNNSLHFLDDEDEVLDLQEVVSLQRK